MLYFYLVEVFFIFSSFLRCWSTLRTLFLWSCLWKMVLRLIKCLLLSKIVLIVPIFKEFIMLLPIIFAKPLFFPLLIQLILFPLVTKSFFIIIFFISLCLFFKVPRLPVIINQLWIGILQFLEFDFAPSAIFVIWMIFLSELQILFLQFTFIDFWILQPHDVLCLLVGNCSLWEGNPTFVGSGKGL